MEKQTIYDGISYKELIAIKKKIKGSKIVQVSAYDGWRYALYNKQGMKLNLD